MQPLSRTISSNGSGLGITVLSENELEEILTTASRIRALEQRVVKESEEGRIPQQVYLSLGQEYVAATVHSLLQEKKPAIFTQHRSHSYFIAFGGSPQELLWELRGETTKSQMRGFGGSIGLFDSEISFFGHTGLMGEQIYVGTGWTLSTGQESVIVAGDATFEEDYTFPALGFAAKHGLPITFICEDNGLAVMTPTEKRRTWQIEDVANAYGVTAARVMDDPVAIAATLSAMPYPRLLVVDVQRSSRHVGFQSEGSPLWDRDTLFRAFCGDMLGSRRTNEAVTAAISEIDSLL